MPLYNCNNGTASKPRPAVRARGLGLGGAALRRTALVVLLVLLTPLFSFAAPAENAGPAEGAEPSKSGGNPFRVVGYYSGDLFDDPVSRLRTDILTHVIYGFLIPRADGSLEPIEKPEGLEPIEKPEKLRAVVEKAHADGAKVFISLGGWSYKGEPLYSTFEKIAASDELRERLIQNVLAFMDKYGIDGLDLDWEHPTANSIGIYEKFVVEFGKALNSKGLSFTSAINGAWSTTAGPEVSTLMTDACLDSFEFVNIMAYDMNFEEHSPLWFANTSLEYWLARGVAAEKLVVGLPLYGRPSWLQYRQLVELDRENAWRDFAATEPLPSYYNGLRTLHEKTLTALRKGGGVMIFDVNEDTDDAETSAMVRIGEVVKRNAGLTKGEIREKLTVFLDEKELVFAPEEGMGEPFIDENGRTLMPFRKPLEAIGASVTYDAGTRSASAVLGGTQAVAPIGETYILVNGARADIDTKSVLVEGRTYLPLRAMFEAFGRSVDWHEFSRSVVVGMAKSD